MMNNRLEEALEICLKAVETGVDPENILSLYPDLSAELRPALQAATAARSLRNDYVPSAAVQRSRTRLLAHANQLRRSRRPRFSFAGLPRLAFVALTVALLFFFGLQGLTVASAKALPGDPLYRIKRATEDLRLRVSASAQSRRSFEVRFNQRRVEEITGLIALGRQTGVRFEGVVTEQSQDAWIVDGMQIRFHPATEFIGAISLGTVVEVRGVTDPQGWVLADEVRLSSYELIGRLDAVTAERWTISGVDLLVSALSQIDPAARLGDQVLVLIKVSEDGFLEARAILRMLQPTLAQTAVPGAQLALPGFEVNDDLEIEFYGQVEVLGVDAWIISGRTVQILPGTEIKNLIAVGDLVKVHAFFAVDGATIVAREIELANDDDDADDADDDADDADDDADDADDDADDADDDDADDAADAADDADDADDTDDADDSDDDADIDSDDDGIEDDADDNSGSDD